MIDVSFPTLPSLPSPGPTHGSLRQLHFHRPALLQRLRTEQPADCRESDDRPESTSAVSSPRQRPTWSASSWMKFAAAANTPRPSIAHPTGQTELKRIGRTVQPIGSPDARFQVTRAETVPDEQNSALVHSIWSEPNGDGTSSDFQVVWAVEQESGDGGSRDWRWKSSQTRSA